VLSLVDAGCFVDSDWSEQPAVHFIPLRKLAVYVANASTCSVELMGQSKCTGCFVGSDWSEQPAVHLANASICSVELLDGQNAQFQGSLPFFCEQR